MSTNQELAKIFYEIADYLEMERVAFKPYAYQRAALALEGLREPVEVVYKKGGRGALEEIPGVGKSIAEKIEEYIRCGKIQYYDQLKRKMPISLEEIISVEGVGPRKAKILYQKLGIRNLKELERAAKNHKIAPLFGFGDKTEKNILQGIAFLKRSHGRFLLGEILPTAREVEEKLKKLKWVQKVDMAGSLRRRKETIGDVDFLVISDEPHKVMDFFVSLPGVLKIWGKGSTKASVRMRDGFDMDIRVLPAKSYGAALQYFTGSKEHNIATRKLAMTKGLKLSEYGVFRGKKMIAAYTEEKIYETIGLPWICPELREDEGEIEAALKGQLPALIENKDIKGDLHIHSNWNGGADPIEELARAGRTMGYEYIGISDHTKFLRIEHGLNEKQLASRNKEIDRINSRLRQPALRRKLRPASPELQRGEQGEGFGGQAKFRILKGCEANILNDGSIDVKDTALSELDYVIAGVHSSLKMSKSQMTERLIRAMQNPHVDIIAHPTGRLLKRRDEYQIDLDKILRVAKETGTVLEIDASPERLDLNDQNIRKAKAMGVKMVINTDTHRRDQMRYMELGVAQARRGWAEKKDIINTWPLDELLAALKK